MALVKISCAFINWRFVAQKLVLARTCHVDLSCAHRHVMLLCRNNSVELIKKRRGGGILRWKY